MGDAIAEGAKSIESIVENKVLFNVVAGSEEEVFHAFEDSALCLSDALGNFVAIRLKQRGLIEGVPSWSRVGGDPGNSTVIHKKHLSRIIWACLIHLG